MVENWLSELARHRAHAVGTCDEEAKMQDDLIKVGCEEVVRRRGSSHEWVAVVDGKLACACQVDGTSCIVSIWAAVESMG